MIILGVYILKSLKNKRYYIGSTDNINRQIIEHNNGLVTATKNIRPPLELIKLIPCSNITEARKSEYRLKKYKRRDIIEKVIKDGLFPWEYKNGPIVKRYHASMAWMKLGFDSP